MARGQNLQVVFFDGHQGAGKVGSWDDIAADARKRSSFEEKKQRFIESLPDVEQTRLRSRSTDAGTSRQLPRTSRSERQDDEELLFRKSLSPDERMFLEAHAGLGNSQKAEVAWLERRYKETGDVGYLYEELEVVSFCQASFGCLPEPGQQGRGGKA